MERSLSPGEDGSSTLSKEEAEEERMKIVVGEGEGEGEGEEGEGEGESVGCVKSCELFFSVGEVRRRLSNHVAAPKKTFKRDPEDPSGTCTCTSPALFATYMMSCIPHVQLSLPHTCT